MMLFYMQTKLHVGLFSITQDSILSRRLSKTLITECLLTSICGCPYIIVGWVTGCITLTGCWRLMCMCMNVFWLIVSIRIVTVNSMAIVSMANIGVRRVLRICCYWL